MEVSRAQSYPRYGLRDDQASRCCARDERAAPVFARCRAFRQIRAGRPLSKPEWAGSPRPTLHSPECGRWSWSSRSICVRAAPCSLLGSVCSTLAGCGGGSGGSAGGGSPGTGLTVPSANARPVAAVLSTSGTEVPLNRATSFDGSGSTDANGDSLTYRWTLASRPTGSAAALSAASGVSVDLTADVPGDYIVTLVVSDGKLDSNPTSATVRAGNTAPVANAGIDRSLACRRDGRARRLRQFRHQRGPPDVCVDRRGTAERQHGGGRRCRPAGRALRARRRW